MNKKPTTAQMRKDLKAIRNMTSEEKEENRQKLLSPSQIKEVLYHATPKNFKKFKPGGDDIKKSGHGIWLSMVAERQPAMHNISGRGDDLFKHGTNVMPVHVQSRTPLVLDSQEMDDWARNAFAGGSGNFPYMMPKEWADAVQAEGYDSIYNPRSKEVVMFDPTKIKSAIGNRGTYDTTRSDITKSKGGNVSIDQMRLELMNKGGLSKQERRANRKKFMEPSKDKRRFYHGSKEPNIVEFKTRKQIADENYPDDPSSDYRDERNAIFLSPDPKFTRHFSVEGYTDTGQAPTTYPVHVQVRNPFDFDKPKHRENLWKTYHDIYYNPESELYAHGPHDTASEKTLAETRMKERIHESHKDENNWPLFENPYVQQAIQDMGHDSFYIRERGTKNLGVYDPSRIKSAIGNRGTYDVNDPDINKAKGGIVSLLRKHGRPVESDLDAMRKMSNGHRVFVAHEQDEVPTEIHRVSDMHGYTPDQIYTVDPKHFAKGGSTPQMFNIQHKRDDRIPELEMAVKALLSGNITRAQYDKILNKLKPVTPYTAVPRPATDEEALMALHEAKRGKWRGADKWEAGRNVGLRLDIPAYSEHGVWVNSIHDEDNGGVAYGPVSAVENAVFHGGDKKAQDVATGEKSKSPFARIKGMWLPTSDQDAVKQMQKYLKHSDWAQIGYDPRRRDYFYGRQDSRQPVESAEKVLQIGPLVLAKAPKFGSRKNYKLSEGGQVTHAHHLDIEERPL